MKKSIKFGDVLDFSTLEKRKESCFNELKLNKRLTNDIYLSVEQINENGKFGDEGNPLEYLVKMRQLNQDNLLTIIAKEGKLDFKIIEKIAQKIAKFHKENIVYPSFSIFESIFEKWDENFRTTKTYPSFPFDSNLEQRIYRFLEENKNFWDKRKEEGNIVDGHGDLILNNIFYENEELIIFDCIDFNDMLRIQDRLEEVCFLAMDLDFHQMFELSNYFLLEYFSLISEDIIAYKSFINFYKCYRAYVRAKVYGSQLIQEISPVQQKILSNLIFKYMKLATSYDF